MEIVEQTLGELEDLYNVIAKTYETFKKCPKVRLTRGYVSVKLKAIEDYWQQFRHAHTTLMKNVKKEQRKLLPYFEQNHYYICEEVAMEARSQMQDLLFTIELQQKSSTEQEIMNVSLSHQVHATQVKLPRIEIPKFFGSYEAFPTFQDLFLTLVHENKTLSGVQKLHYLKTSVGGEAELLLRHIQISEANYVQAWETLKRRYSNKRLIVTSLLKRMFNQKKLNSQNSNHIKLLIDTTSECLNSLKNMNIKTEDWDPLINFILVQKLDTETHKEWEEHVSSKSSDELPTFESLKEFLESKFRTLELVQQPASSREKIVLLKRHVLCAKKNTHLVTVRTLEKWNQNNEPSLQNQSTFVTIVWFLVIVFEYVDYSLNADCVIDVTTPYYIRKRQLIPTARLKGMKINSQGFYIQM